MVKGKIKARRTYSPPLVFDFGDPNLNVAGTSYSGCGTGSGGKGACCSGTNGVARLCSAGAAVSSTCNSGGAWTSTAQGCGEGAAPSNTKCCNGVGGTCIGGGVQG